MNSTQEPSTGSSWWEVSFDAPAPVSDDLAALLFDFDALGTETHSDGFPLPRLPDAQGNPPAEAQVQSRAGFDRVIASFAPSHSQAELVESVRETFACLNLAPPDRIEAVFREDAAWRESWKAFFKPLQLSPSIWVCPSWETFEAPVGAMVLTLDPGFAFGTGQHPTTGLCVASLEALMPHSAHDTMLDVGCGSGILSLAGLRLGVSRAVGVDIDPHSIDATRKNAETNGVTERVELPDVAVEEITETFPLVVANILAIILIRLAETLLSRTSTDGTLLLSGILESQEQEVHRAYNQAAQSLGRAPLPAPRISQREDWITMTYHLGHAEP